ncbi:MAG: alpha-L-rhamnosidase N-terminal domain-containing protein, partial [Pseudomonadota bacterium]
MRNRAPFIWTPKQPIDQMAMLSVMTGTEPRAESANRWFLFRRTFELAEVPGSAPLHITVDGRYQLFVNGTRIGRGPARCSPLYQRYDSYDVGAALMPGANSIAVLVRVFGKDMSWYEQTKGMWQPTFGDGGLWVATDLTEAGADGALTTDTEWRCIEADAWNGDAPQANHGLGFIEDLDARRLPEDWTATGYDDAGWDAAQIMQAGGGGPEAFFGGMRTVPFPVLQPNTIGPLAETELRPERIAWTKSVEVRDEAPLHDQIYTEPLSDPDADAVKDVEALLNAEGRTHITTAPGRGVSILFDFGRITTIHPFIEIEAKGGEQIDIAVAERLPDEWTDGGPAADSRIARTPLLGLDAHLSRYTARPGRQRFERFEWQAAKWMQVTIRNAPEGVDILSLGGVYTRFGAEARGRFDCSDPVLNRLWETGRYTLQLCMHDGWEDCPSREQRQWLGDATVENLVGHAAFGPGIADLNAEFLRKAAESQRPDGLTQMFAPGNHGDNGILIPDWTLQWILNARDHAVWTGDLGVIEEIFPAIERALAWFARLRNENGLVADMPYWHFMDWSGVGRAGEACTLNAQLAGCLDAAAALADQLQMPRKADTYRADANAIRHALDRRHWDEARGVYVDMVDPENGEQNPRVSQHANAAMILWGDAPADRWPRMIDYISDPERITFTPA